MSCATLLVPLGHVGHWAMYAIYAVPIVVVLASVVRTLMAERRERP